MSKTTLTTLRQMKQEGEKIAVLTAYDAIFARTLEQAGIDVLLVGDSLGMVLQGQESTLPVSMSDMVYHTQAVRRGSQSALIVTDMPFMSYRTKELALENAGSIMQSGAHVVKLEGGHHILDTVKALTAYGIPVCGHLGLVPQSVNKLGGYRVQGRDDHSAQAIINDAWDLQDAGADMLVLECVPAELAAKVSESLEIPVIGIGAGAHCDGQVLVLHDMLGMGHGKPPKFVQDFLLLSSQAGAEQDRPVSISNAIEAYVKAVKTGSFPAATHSFS